MNDDLALGIAHGDRHRMGATHHHAFDNGLPAVGKFQFAGFSFLFLRQIYPLKRLNLPNIRLRARRVKRKQLTCVGRRADIKETQLQAAFPVPFVEFGLVSCVYAARHTLCPVA